MGTGWHVMLTYILKQRKHTLAPDNPIPGRFRCAHSRLPQLHAVEVPREPDLQRSSDYLQSRKGEF